MMYLSENSSSLENSSLCNVGKEIERIYSSMKNATKVSNLMEKRSIIAFEDLYNREKTLSRYESSIHAKQEEFINNKLSFIKETKREHESLNENIRSLKNEYKKLEKTVIRIKGKMYRINIAKFRIREQIDKKEVLIRKLDHRSFVVDHMNFNNSKNDMNLKISIEHDHIREYKQKLEKCDFAIKAYRDNMENLVADIDNKNSKLKALFSDLESKKMLIKDLKDKRLAFFDDLKDRVNIDGVADKFNFCKKNCQEISREVYSKKHILNDLCHKEFKLGIGNKIMGFNCDYKMKQCRNVGFNTGCILGLQSIKLSGEAERDYIFSIISNHCQYVNSEIEKIREDKNHVLDMLRQEENTLRVVNSTFLEEKKHAMELEEIYKKMYTHENSFDEDMHPLMSKKADTSFAEDDELYNFAQKSRDALISVYLETEESFSSVENTRMKVLECEMHLEDLRRQVLIAESKLTQVRNRNCILFKIDKCSITDVTAIIEENKRRRDNVIKSLHDKNDNLSQEINVLLQKNSHKKQRILDHELSGCMASLYLNCLESMIHGVQMMDDIYEYSIFVDGLLKLMERSLLTCM